MELTTEIKNFVILYKDRSKKFITSKQASILFQESASKPGILLSPNEYVDFNTIAKISTLEEFYSQYPDERPVITPVWKEPVDNYRPLEKTVTDKSKWLRGIISGLKKLITENPESPKAMAMLKQYVKIYRQRYGELK